jgi:hypothetical protein
VYDILFFVYVITLSYYVKLLNNLILRLIVLCYVFFLLTVVASNRLAKLFLILLETILFVNVVKLYSVRVVLFSTSRECNPS